MVSAGHSAEHLRFSCQLNPHNNPEKVTSSILNLEMMKNKLREIKGLTQIIMLQFDGYI